MFNVQVTSTTMKLLPVVCLCLVTRCGMTSAAEKGPAVVKVEQDRDVILPCSLSTKENIELKLFDWKKAAQKDEKQKEVFFYDAGVHYNNGRSGQSEQFKGRVSHFPEELKHGNASIIIRNTKMADSGDYTCVFPRLDPRQTFHIKLVVGAAPEPSFTIIEMTKDWSRLQCVVRGVSPKPKVEWKDSSGKILPAEEPQVTDRGGSYDIILRNTVNKTDYYSCVATQEEINHQTETKIHVYISGAATEPSVKIVRQTDDGALLQCVVRGASPKPKVEWQDSSGNKLPAEEPQVTDRGGSYDIILQTTVTKTDYYHCVVTQEEINHQISAETFVPLNGSSAGLVAVAVVVSVLCTLLVVGVVLAAKRCIKHKHNEDSPISAEVLDAEA